jgi:hypothetical protein
MAYVSRFGEQLANLEKWQGSELQGAHATRGAATVGLLSNIGDTLVKYGEARNVVKAEARAEEQREQQDELLNLQLAEAKRNEHQAEIDARVQELIAASFTPETGQFSPELGYSHRWLTPGPDYDPEVDAQYRLSVPKIQREFDLATDSRLNQINKAVENYTDSLAGVDSPEGFMIQREAIVAAGERRALVEGVAQDTYTRGIPSPDANFLNWDATQEWLDDQVKIGMNQTEVLQLESAQARLAAERKDWDSVDKTGAQMLHEGNIKTFGPSFNLKTTQAEVDRFMEEGYGSRMHPREKEMFEAWMATYHLDEYGAGGEEYKKKLDTALTVAGVTLPDSVTPVEAARLSTGDQMFEEIEQTRAELRLAQDGGTPDEVALLERRLNFFTDRRDAYGEHRKRVGGNEVISGMTRQQADTLSDNHRTQLDQLKANYRGSSGTSASIVPTDPNFIESETELEEKQDAVVAELFEDGGMPSPGQQLFLFKEVAKILHKIGKVPSWSNVYQFLGEDANINKLKKEVPQFGPYNIHDVPLFQHYLGRDIALAPREAQSDLTEFPTLLSAQDIADLEGVTIEDLLTGEGFSALSALTSDEEKMNAELAREFPQTSVMGSLSP